MKKTELNSKWFWVRQLVREQMRIYCNHPDKMNGLFCMYLEGTNMVNALGVAKSSEEYMSRVGDVYMMDYKKHGWKIALLGIFERLADDFLEENEFNGDDFLEELANWTLKRHGVGRFFPWPERLDDTPVVSTLKIKKDECLMPWLEVPLTEVTHKKTGNKYMQLCTCLSVLDCTNSRDGTEVAVYYRDGRLFVREMSEFEEKFER